MTELRQRGGGGGDPDSADNISDKVKRPTASRERLVSQLRPRPQNKFLRLLSDVEAAELSVFSNRANKLVSCCNPATTSTQTHKTVHTRSQTTCNDVWFTSGLHCRHFCVFLMSGNLTATFLKVKVGFLTVNSWRLLVSINL